MRWRHGEAVHIGVMSFHVNNPDPAYDWAREYWSRAEIEVGTTREERREMSWMMFGAQCRVERVTALEVEHKVPLWQVADLADDERRRYFGPENLWLLCPACHKAKSREEAARRAQERRKVNAART